MRNIDFENRGEYLIHTIENIDGKKYIATEYRNMWRFSNSAPTTVEAQDRLMLSKLDEIIESEADIQRRIKARIERLQEQLERSRFETSVATGTQYIIRMCLKETDGG